MAETLLLEDKRQEAQPTVSTPSVNAIAAIGAELDEAQQKMDEVPTEVGMLSIKTANQTIYEASTRPDPIPLWLTLWYEGEVCCLFADSNLGKSIYAVQIASHIAQRQRVLYFDFELSEKQFQLRYTDDVTRQLHKFPDNLLRVSIDRERMRVEDFENQLIAQIEEVTVRSRCKVIIIDNLSYICMGAEKGETAGELMKRLMLLKGKYGLSILVLAHTPKRPLNQAISQNDLAGSKKLMNFFDSSFAIGKSAKDENLRYIKQVKVRYGNFEYGADNVIVCAIEKQGSFLQFVNIDTAPERLHLKEESEEDRKKLINEARALRAQGLSLRDIGVKLNISKNKVKRLLDEGNAQKANSSDNKEECEQ